MSKELTVGYVSPIANLIFRGDLFGRSQSERTYPKIDMWREGKDLYLEASIPGLAKEHLSIIIEEDVLTIQGQLTEIKENNSSDNEILVREIKRSAFTRSIQLPNKNCPEPEATLQNGILKLKFNDVFKDTISQRRQISIK